MSEGVTDREAADVRARLGRHGYGFQHAVVKKCVELQRERKTLWRFDTTEFPVELNGARTHVDVILRSSSGLIAMECKRANPALSRWILGRSHFRSSADGELRQVRLDSINYESVPQIVRAAPEWSDDQYHVGVEIKNNETKGDAGSSGRGALDDAVSRALRGAGGLINEIVRRHGDTVLGLTTRTVVIPVVVTTARLLTWDGDLADADLQTGQLPEGVTVQERPWVWLRVNASDHLRHSAPATQSSRHQHRATSSFGSLADLEYANSVGVVSSTGLEAFLGAASYHTGDH